MASPARTSWQNAKKQLNANDQKLFKENLGPLLDKVYDAYNAYLKELNKKPICDLPRLKDRIQEALILYGKAGVIMNKYREILAKLPATAGSGKTQGKTTLDALSHVQGQQVAEMRKRLPSDADVKKFKLDMMNAALKQIGGR
jgi:hypothetical protein